MKYIYVKKNEYIQGLPAMDIDDKDLSEHQKLLLDGAVAMGVYKPAAEASKKKEEKKDDGKS